MFNKYTVQRGQRGNKTNETRKKNTKSEQTQLFVKTLDEQVKNDKNWRRCCFMFVTKSDLETLDLLKREKSFPPRITENQGIMDFLSDLINHRFAHKENKPRGAFMKNLF